jgi:peptidyl-prolyl cis-trans isomerase C
MKGLRLAMVALLSGWIALAASPASAEEDPVVAAVNGVEIRLSQAQAAHKRLPEQYQRVPFETIFPGLVDSLIDTRLAADNARREKLHETEKFKVQIAWITDQVLQRLMLSKTMEGTVTDAAVRARYEEEAKKLAATEQIKASHILLKTEEEAKKVLALLDKGGDFAELAKKNSTGPSASDGGSLGFFGRGQMVPAFEKAAYALKAGTYTKKAVKTQFGWHVIKVDDRKRPDPPSFETMEPELRNALFQETGAALIMKLRKEAEISLFNLDGTPRKPASK